MINENKIRSLLESKEVNEVWMDIQQALPHLAFCSYLSEERMESCVDFLFDNISVCYEMLKQHNFSPIEIDDLIVILSDSRKPFLDFCCKTLLYQEGIEFNINDYPYTLEELGMTEDELKQLEENADYDCSYILSELIEFCIIINHPSLLAEYYKELELADFEKRAMDMLNFYSSLK